MMSATKTPAALCKRWPGNAKGLTRSQVVLNHRTVFAQLPKTSQPALGAGAGRTEYAACRYYFA
jgi:hypothetical protein